MTTKSIPQLSHLLPTLKTAVISLVLVLVIPMPPGIQVLLIHQPITALILLRRQWRSLWRIQRLQIGETSLVTFTFDETPTGFTQGDVTVESGSLSGFTVTADDKGLYGNFHPDC